MNKRIQRIFAKSSSLLMAIIFCFLMTSIIFAQQPDSTEAQRQSIRRVFQRFGLNWQRGNGVAVDRDGKITGIRGIPIESDSSSRPEDRVYNFLEHNADLFGMSNPRQELLISSDSRGVIRLHQVINGLEVFGSFIDIDLAYNEIDINYFPDARNVDTTPSIDSLEAGRIAQADPIHDNSHAYACCYELFISSTYDGLHPFDSGGAHLVWKFGVLGGYEGEATYWIDAHSGQILDARSSLR